MKATLVVSMALNVLMTGLLLWPDSVEEAESRQRLPTRPMENRVEREIREHGEGDLASGLFNWADLDSDDYEAFIANLRSIGCPEQTIRDIVTAELDRLNRSRDSVPDASDLYWQSAAKRVRSSRDALRERERFQKEKSRVLEALLGKDAGEGASRPPDRIDGMVSFLPEEKRDLVKGVIQKYEELEREIHRRAPGRLFPQDQEELRQLSAARLDELSRHLSPTELEGYELRFSEAADRLRETLSGFDPAEEEFQAIFRLQREFEDRLNAPARSTGEEEEKERLQAYLQFEEGLAKALGSERHTEYRKAQNPAYTMLVRIADRYELPRATADQVFEIRHALEQEMARAQDSGMEFDRVAAVFEAMRQEAAREVRTILGDQAFESYLSYGGRWLDASRQ
jgi:hypothetical protein